MNNLRKVSILLLLALLIACFVACNTTDNNTEEPTTEAPTTEAPTQAPEDPTDNPEDDPIVPPEEEQKNWEEDYDIISIEEALAICAANSSPTTERYYIAATIKSISNASYGEMMITDGVNDLYVYGSYGADGVDRYPDLAEKPYKGDTVLLYCSLSNYNGTMQVYSAWIIDFIPADVVINEADYTKATVEEAREAAVGTKLSVTGVVAAITYSNGKIPSGVYLVDNTQSIYVYSADIAQRVKVGNTIRVLGTRDNWILETESNNANKFGYKGCCQLSDATLAELNDTNVDFDKSWITTSTVKDILDTPVTENITTTIYKVNALVKKVPGNGFVNYYFFDIDGVTGAYTYTQCNGSDFTWLDKFDGKICTVYLSALNAKSTATDCYFRFVPVAVIDENYTFDTNNAAEYAVKYHGVGQFLSSYTGDPAKELLTNVDSELLGFIGANLSYTSSNTNVINFVTESGKTVMHCTGSGKATVTVTGTYNGKTFSDTVEITVTKPIDFDYVDVKTAIDSAEDEVVYVKGIVGPSIVNKSGFYLIDETGAIAIICDSSQFEGLMIGHEVIIKGTRENYINPEKSGRFGQTCLVDAEIVVNNYGNHSYSTESFKTTTVAEFKKFDIMTDYTTTVFVMEAKVKVVDAQYYSNIYITDGTNDIMLYCSSSNQYSWLKAYNGQTITIEIAACNWNDKTDSYRGCVLSVITPDGQIFNELNFTTKTN